MSDQPAQNLQNYARYDPPFHFVVLPLLLFNVIYHAVDLLRHLGDGAWPRPAGSLALALALLLLAFKARMYALRVQDRVIRLEERLRLATLLPESLRGRIPQLTESQLIALRFASDDEVAELTRSALDRNLDGKQIREGIRNWRPDYWRV